MTWYPLMQAVISAGADHLTCSKLLKLDDMRMVNIFDVPGCNLLPSDRRQRHRRGLEGGFCWLGWFQLYQSPLQTRRTGPGANSQNILGNDFKMTGKNFFTMQCQLTITMYFTEQAQEHYPFNFWIGDFAGVWGALLQVEHVHLIVPSGHLFVHRIQTLAMELISASRCCCHCCCCCCCCCGKGGQFQTLDAQTATTLSGNWEMEFHSKLDKNQRNIYGIFGSYCKTAHCALRIFNLLFCGAFQPRLM